MNFYYRATPTTAADNFPVAKVAELKKLKTVSSERHVLGSELSSLGVSYLTRPQDYRGFYMNAYDVLLNLLNKLMRLNAMLA